MSSFLFRRLTAYTVAIALTVTLSGCGTLFYPERKGQLSGRVDPGIAILDGLGLLLFIVPGVIAYAIDFSNNTIYLPGSHGTRVEPVSYRGELSQARLAEMIKTHTGRTVDWHGEVLRIDSQESLEETLATVARLDGVSPLPDTAKSDRNALDS
ncbi:hypothetical protein [Salinicola aestuarinus]|uniref:hypothetical protein n=1 Tax=Salinicola aestuarinus TaxID=1949082 RepID=UPI000DA16058|nr:hypothetical protein [Salinicola aestuarinus]